MKNKPRVLFLDIETAPIEAHVWQLWDQNVGLNQIVHDWSVLSWSAKWQGSKSVMYEDVRKQKNKRDDKKLLKKIWQLMDAADIVVGQNSIAFDVKKLNARFIINGMSPPASFRQLDTKRIAKKIFGFTSNRLEYMADRLCTKFKKLKHKEFAGHELWVECLKGNPKAWREMEKYNKHDVLATEELYNRLIAWDNSMNFSVYADINKCSCGCKVFNKYGFRFTNVGKFQRYKCNDCGKEHLSKINLLSTLKKAEMRHGG